VAWLESNRRRLLVGFRFRGERCREYLGLDDNCENRRIAARILKEIDGELAAGNFAAGVMNTFGAVIFPMLIQLYSVLGDRRALIAVSTTVRYSYSELGGRSA